MMNREEFQSSLVQQMLWSSAMAGACVRPCLDQEQQAEASPNAMPSLSSPSVLFSSGLAPPPGLHGHGHGQESTAVPESWSQLLLGGLVGEHERYSSSSAALMAAAVKDEGNCMASHGAYGFYGGGGGHGGEEMQKASQLSQMLLASSSPRSCITTSLGGGGGGGSGGMLDFSNGVAPPPPPAEIRNHHSDNSSECNSTATGSALKKARVQPSSSAQSTLKVRKERLGDRITALHQIVSPFGKTDTASVLQETIGYIRFLLGQIEALSYPYLGHASGNSMQTGPGGERSSCLFPEYPGQLLNHNNKATAPAGEPEQGATDEANAKKDLRSRGLCLVPVSCTSHFGGDNGADYWAPAIGGILR